MLEKDRIDIPVRRQCGLLGLPRSTAYYTSQRNPASICGEIDVMDKIDEIYTDHPHLGRYGMSGALAERYDIVVNPKRVRRLMRKLGLEAIYPKPRKNTSAPGKNHEKRPYLLSGLEIDRVDQVWCADITYIRLTHGFVYLVAVMDWYSRAVLSWELSTTLEAGFCVDALKKALATGRRPEIFNTDQGSQFTSEAFIKELAGRGISVSMDGKGRAFDNIMVERLWRTVKYEDVYLRGYETVLEARMGLAQYFDYYNHERRHRSLDGETPGRVYKLTVRFDAGWRKDRMKQRSGRSAAGRTAVSTVALRAPFETATGYLVQEVTL